jgi:hypothetical protein
MAGEPVAARRGRRWLWIVLWVAAGLAVLAPVVFQRGFGFLVPALLRDLDSALAQTAGHWLSDVWSLFFIPLLLW